ncbi:MAG: class I SAM-dependent methyltransferase [Verrucomicrobiota bacterium]
MDINDIHKNWTDLGQDDAMWVVLTDPKKKGGKWSEAEFFEHGREEIGRVMRSLEEAKLPVRFEKALDFGCGLGRLSQALGNYFTHVDGVDVSASMIEQAKALNKMPEKIHYHLNVKTDLSAFPSESYDFIYSSICLQHIPTNYQLSYISDFMRLLKDGGIAYFQTIHAHGWRKFVPNVATDLFRKLKNRGKAFIPMYGVPASRVRALIERGDGIIKINRAVNYGGWESRFVNDIFVAEKRLVGKF